MNGGRRRSMKRSRRASGSSLSRYGYFNADGTEFIIVRPETPRPWINYLTNEDYCAVISQCAGGYSFFRDCGADRVTRWLPEDWRVDRPGRYLFLCEGTGRTRRVWSATYQPLRVPPDRFEARHGLGYTRVETQTNGIRAAVTYFVPVSDHCEVWMVELENLTSRPRQLEVFPYIEWLLGDYHMELRYRNIMNLYNRVWRDKISGAIFARKTARWADLDIQPFTSTGFFASSLPSRGSVTSKDAFVGRLNTEEHPAMLFEGTFRTVPLCSGEDGIGCFRHCVPLKPQQTVQCSVMLGQTEGVDGARRLITRYRKWTNAAAELERVKVMWRRRILDHVQVCTSDPDFDRMVNIWVKYQLFMCNLWSRSPSYYHEGSGGHGYRDACQDAEGILALHVEHARRKIFTLASLIRRDGTCAPGWSGTSGPSSCRPNKDHPTWLTSTVSAYVKETGDLDILTQRVPYLKDRWVKGWDLDYTRDGGATPDGDGTLFEHLVKNLEFTFSDVGPHGIPRVGHADWNDALDAAGIEGQGESVWLGMALVRSLKLLAELAGRLGERVRAESLRENAKVMSDRINQVAWDGRWYLYGFTDDGQPFGCRARREGTIYLNTQAWAILAGIVGGERQGKLLASVDRYLDSPHGLALLAPAYTTWDPRLGRISMFSEGTKENAAVFCHAATFQIVADLMAGCGDRAYASLRKLMPNAQPDYELYKAEPYVYAEYLVGPDNPYRSGEGWFTWLTGTAGWTFMAATEWLLGVRRDYDGLRIDPCLPSRWKRCTIRRPFRGAIYDIEVLNPHGLQKGHVSLEVDGRPIAGHLVRPHGDGKIHTVRAVLERGVKRRRVNRPAVCSTAVRP